METAERRLWTTTKRGDSVEATSGDINPRARATCIARTRRKPNTERVKSRHVKGDRKSRLARTAGSQANRKEGVRPAGGQQNSG